MSESNGNAKIANLIAGGMLGLIFFSACATALIAPIHIEIDGLQKQINENKRIYEKNHDELDIRLQREFHDINNLTDQKILDLDIRFQKELELNIKDINGRMLVKE